MRGEKARPTRPGLGQTLIPCETGIEHDRLERALDLLDDPALDILVSQSVAFTELPKSLADIWSSPGLPPVVHYSSK